MSRYTPMQIEPCWRDRPLRTQGKRTVRYGHGYIRQDKVKADEVTSWMERWAAATQAARDE